jgi:ADP-ribosyl-[dinitrogen reductase] hydrolase
MHVDAETLSRAQGCLLGQLAGDSLGSLVEFQPPQEIRRKYPHGVRQLEAGGTWGTLAGQPTDDSEMALILARMLVKLGRYDAGEARKAYVFWLNSAPFDCGSTVSSGLRGRPNRESQANGALMRISPLGIFGCNHDLDRVSEYARADAALTHPHPVCLQANALFAMAIAHAIRTWKGARELYWQIRDWAQDMNVDARLVKAIVDASESPPADYVQQQGWVIIAFQNALWQLLYASTLEEGVVDTVMRGGDTDTNAAIAGALLGAVHGRNSIPAQWVDKLLNCRPEAVRPNVRHPRPDCFWPVDALHIAQCLVAGDELDESETV